MYEYRFVRIEVEYNAFATKHKLPKDYHEVIDTHAKEGWRLVQVFAPPVLGQGLAEYFELIFEREK